MLMMTKQIRERMPPLYGQEKLKDPVVWVKYFTPWTNWTWYGTEFDGIDRLFGLVYGHEAELGYFTLSELKAVRGPFGLRIERDRYFVPKRLSEVRALHAQGRAANPRGHRKEALAALGRYREDVRAGHKGGAEYWKGQAAALFTANPTAGYSVNPVSTKTPYEQLPARGFRRCSFCGEVTYTRRYRRKDICTKCHNRKRKNPYEGLQEAERILAGKPPRMAFFVNEDTRTANGEFIALIALENQPGFRRTDWYWGKDLATASEAARQRNERLGLSEEEAARIVATSVKAQFREKGAESFEGKNPSKRPLKARQDWMRRYEKELLLRRPDLKGHIDWRSASLLYKQGDSPETAAIRMRAVGDPLLPSEFQALPPTLRLLERRGLKSNPGTGAVHWHFRVTSGRIKTGLARGKYFEKRTPFRHMHTGGNWDHGHGKDVTGFGRTEKSLWNNHYGA